MSERMSADLDSTINRRVVKWSLVAEAACFHHQISHLDTPNFSQHSAGQIEKDGSVMKKVGDIMKEMGFREEASTSVKEAFIKNLIRSAYGVDVETPSEKRAKEIKKLTQTTPAAEVQLSFDFTKVS